jgi:GTP-binding protein Era
MRSGFVSIIGPPNAGKSTLLNALVGEKLAIVTPKPQTTRNRILGIVNLARRPRAAAETSESAGTVRGRRAGQIIFVDTPGIHKPVDTLNRRMMQEVHNALEGCDLLLLILDATRTPASPERANRRDISPQHAHSGRAGARDAGEQFAIELARRSKLKTFLLLNKIDLVEKSKLLPLIEHYSRLHDFAEIIPISAAKRDGLKPLLDKVVEALPEGPRYFPPDQLTDQPERFIAAEFIREQVLLLTRQEIPYSSSVVVERFEEEPRLTWISAVIYVQREGQKAIVVGRQGAMLKAIGTRARQEIERLLNRKVFLELLVKVRGGWRDSGEFVDELDWRKQLK